MLIIFRFTLVISATFQYNCSILSEKRDTELDSYLATDNSVYKRDCIGKGCFACLIKQNPTFRLFVSAMTASVCCMAVRWTKRATDGTRRHRRSLLRKQRHQTRLRLRRIFKPLLRRLSRQTTRRHRRYCSLCLHNRLAPPNRRVSPHDIP